VFRNISRTGGNINGLNGTLQLKGTGSQTIPANLFQNNNLKNLIHSNTHLAAGVTLLGPVNIYRSLTFGLPSTTAQRFNGAGYLTLKSTATETAWLGKVTGKTFLGATTVERYIPSGVNHGKSWQLITSPIKGTQTVKQAWQDTATAANQNRYPGYGTQITSALSGALSLGFDVYTPTGPSMKLYDQATNNYIGIPSTSTYPIQNQKGYMVFVRGDRGDTAFNVAAHPTTLRAKGTLYTTGVDVPPVTTIPANKFETIANPYASSIEFTSILYDGPPGIDNLFYVWDPLLTGAYGYGGFQTISAMNGDFYPTPGGTANYPSNVRCTKIQSGQAFMMHAGAMGGTVTFTEDAKIDSSRMVNRLVNNQSVNNAYWNARLYANVNGNDVISDGNVIAMNDHLSNEITNDDALKVMNGHEYFGINKNGQLLAVEAKRFFTSTDTVFYHTANLRTSNYKLQFAPLGLSDVQLTPMLIDNYLHTATPLSLSDTSNYVFSATANTASSSVSRFMIVFKPASPLPVKFVGINAKRNADASVLVNWSVVNQQNIELYEVQRSFDGLHFEKIHEKTSQLGTLGLIHYDYIDSSASSCVNIYRAKAIEANGTYFYSNLTKVNALTSKPNFTVSPNPVTDNTIHLVCNNLILGNHQFEIINNLGEVLYKESKQISNTNAQFTIKPNVNLPKATYILKITNINGQQFYIKLKWG
jgi:hypothetical protein